MITNLTNTRWVLNYNNLDLISNNPQTHYIDFISMGKNIHSLNLVFWEEASISCRMIQLSL